MNYGASERAGSKDINCLRLQIGCAARQQVTVRSNKIGTGWGFLREPDYFTSVIVLLPLLLALSVEHLFGH